MYELSKVRLYSVGPAGARYEDVTIDLSDVGPPVRGQQLVLGRPEIRRPSPASILFLENGGGKSVLIKLIFSVMLPGRRQVVGTSNSKVLENFVGRDDVAHVVLEWMHTSTGRRLLTGKVSDWRRRSPQTGESGLVDLWYSLRPNNTVGIATLPFAENGANLVAHEFRSRLDDLAETDPTLELNWADRHWKWTEQLGDLGLDSELFRYQRAMNAGEGEAADAFTFATDEAFVDFLLKAVLPAGDHEDLAASITGHAEKLAKRGDLEKERTFVEEVLGHLGPLHEQRVATTRAQRDAAAAADELAGFVTRLVARVMHETGLLEQRQQHIADLTEATATAERALGGAKDVQRALAYRTAELRVTASLSAQEDAATAHTSAHRVVQGWAATRKLLDHEAAAEGVATLRKVVAERQDAAQVALRARNEKARAVARALIVTVDAALDQSQQEDAALAGLRKSVEATEKSWRSAVEGSLEATLLATQLDQRASKVDEEVRTAVRDGLAGSAASLAQDAVAVADQMRVDSAAVEEAGRRLEGLGNEVETARTELAEARQVETDARSCHDNAQASLRRADVAAAALAGEPRLVELLDTDDVMLEYDAETLLDQLVKAQADFDRRRTALRVADAADEPARLLWADDPDALLPPHHEVTHIRNLLESDGIACGTGWDYLADRSDEAVRAALVRQLPHLAGGVLVNKPEHLDRAREVIAEREYHPTGTVVVATPHSFDVDVDVKFDLSLRPAAGFVAPPSPALYDRSAAKEECARITQEHAVRTAQLSELDAAYATDQALAARLVTWRGEYPVGTLAALADAVTSAETALREAEKSVAHRVEVLGSAIKVRDELRVRLVEMRQALDTTKERARRLAELADKVREAAVWRQDAGLARSRADGEERRAGTFSLLLTRLREDIETGQRRADSLRALAARTHEEINELPGDTAANREDPVPDQPVAVLRKGLQHAQRVYDQAAVGDDQLKDLRQAEAKATEARLVWEQEPLDVREAARHLLNSTEGADVASRATAATLADSRLLSADQVLRAASEGHTACKVRLEQSPKPPVPLDLVRQPRDVPHGDQLTAEAAEVAEQAAAVHEKLLADLYQARDKLAAAGALADSFKMIAETHHAAADDQPGAYLADVEPFGGDVEAARERYAELRRTAARAHRTAQDAQHLLNSRAEQLELCAADSRFEAMVIPIRVQIRGVASSALGDHAEEWMKQLRPRLRSLTDDLEQIDRHRNAILERLTAIVDGAFLKLLTAQRLSKLPAGLGSWTGMEFLRIGGKPVEGDLLTHQLAQVLDDAVERYKSSGKVDGLAVVLRSVRAAVPKGFKVTMLKPDAVLRTERVGISEVRDVFSGGQHLTAAIILYCTLAALRANDQGKARHHHSGVLFLDNPIGRASATYLLDLQLGVATALGVQLVYTTGLYEEEALGGFPLIVRLRNDSAVRAGRKYLSVHERIMPHLQGLAPPDDTGVLTSIRTVLPRRRRDETD
ncbi:hypothetical protein [Frankia tisae]|uniref:hypothetical protein n=1 Tax=Frankia tisae TaxID=2950104 RepID=UPI0021BFB9E9|nr:hypothetical protein [Frankia tisae]